MSPPQLIETRKRSVAKAASYRVAIVCLDFLAIYIFTKKIEIALGFMLLSNVYTTVAYFLHERLWTRIHWGTTLSTEKV
jgi:adenylylsulfate kinase